MHSKRPKGLYPFKGGYHSPQEIAVALRTTPKAVSRYYYRHGTMDGYTIGGMKGKGIVPKGIELSGRYNTLHTSHHPFDKAVLAAGFRSICRFAKEVHIPLDMLGRWKRNLPRSGKPLGTTALGEMILPNGRKSKRVLRIEQRLGTDITLLFPDIFTLPKPPKEKCKKVSPTPLQTQRRYDII